MGHQGPSILFNSIFFFESQLIDFHVIFTYTKQEFGLAVWKGINKVWNVTKRQQNKGKEYICKTCDLLNKIYISVWVNSYFKIHTQRNQNKTDVVRLILCKVICEWRKCNHLSLIVQKNNYHIGRAIMYFQIIFKLFTYSPFKKKLFS